MNFITNIKGKSLSMSVTDKRSYVYTTDNTSQGIFLPNNSLVQQIWTPIYSVFSYKNKFFFIKSSNTDNTVGP